MRRLAIAAAVLALAGLPTLGVRAQRAATPSLSLRPATVVAHGTFGQSMVETIELEDGTQVGFGYRMQAEDVIVRHGRRVFVPAGDTPGSIAASAVFSRRAGYVAPGRSAAVQVRLTVPNHTAVRAVVVFFRATSAVAQAGSVSLTGSLGSLITFVLTKDFALAGGQVRVLPPTAGRNLTVVQQLRNVGTEPVIPRGVVAFIDARGALAAKIAFDTRRLLPGERATYRASYAGRLPPGRYRVLATFGYEGKTLAGEGVYTAP